MVGLSYWWAGRLSLAAFMGQDPLTELGSTRLSLDPQHPVESSAEPLRDIGVD